MIQRVNYAQVWVKEREWQRSGQIEKGLLVLAGIHENDTKDIADKMIKKLIGLRVFEDHAGKTNLALGDISGELMIVSQFTLYADCKKGNRPSFINAGSPQMAKELYQYILDTCSQSFGYNVQHGEFGADMKISLENDGPFTIVLDSDEIL